MIIPTSIIAASGVPIHLKFSDKNVTGTAIAPFLGSFLKSNPLFLVISNLVSSYNERYLNPLNEYTDFDLLFTRMLLTLLGYPNLTDVEIAKQDPLVRETVGRIASTSTLCREETSIGLRCEVERNARLKGRDLNELPKHDPDAIGSTFFKAVNEVMLADTLRRIPKSVKYLVLDCDSTFIKVEGNQEGSAFCGKNGANGYFPLLCFLQGDLVHIQNAPGATDGRRLLEDCLEPMIVKIQKEFPKTPLLLRADAGFNSNKVVDICNKYKVYFVMGLTGAEAAIEKVCERIKRSLPGPVSACLRGLPAKLCEIVWPHNGFELGDLKPLEKPVALCGKVKGYQAKSWSEEREIYYRVQVNPNYDVDFRFVQTNIPARLISFFCSKLGTAKNYCNPKDCVEKKKTAQNAIDLYYGLYCNRAKCELDIKSYKDCGIGTKLSAKGFFTNWYRLVLGAIAQHIFNALKEAAFKKDKELSQWRRASFSRFLKELVRLPASLKRYRKRLLVSVATIDDENRRKAFEAVSLVSY